MTGSSTSKRSRSFLKNLQFCTVIRLLIFIYVTSRVVLSRYWSTGPYPGHLRGGRTDPSTRRRGESKEGTSLPCHSGPECATETSRPYDDTHSGSRVPVRVSAMCTNALFMILLNRTLSELVVLPNLTPSTSPLWLILGHRVSVPPLPDSIPPDSPHPSFRTTLRRPKWRLPYDLGKYFRK